MIEVMTSIESKALRCAISQEIAEEIIFNSIEANIPVDARLQLYKQPIFDGKSFNELSDKDLLTNHHLNHWNEVVLRKYKKSWLNRLLNRLYSC